jgi:hypothetical protein
MADALDLAKLKLGDFSPHLNTGFEICLPDGKTVPVTLAKAASNDTVVPAGGMKTPQGQTVNARAGGGFSLQFVAPQISDVTQGLYTVKHPKLGTMEIFLVPSGTTPQGHGYHAVFA